MFFCMCVMHIDFRERPEQTCLRVVFGVLHIFQIDSPARVRCSRSKTTAPEGSGLSAEVLEKEAKAGCFVRAAFIAPVKSHLRHKFCKCRDTDGFLILLWKCILILFLLISTQNHPENFRVLSCVSGSLSSIRTKTLFVGFLPNAHRENPHIRSFFTLFDKVYIRI